jgi:hypothetical protein
MRSRDLNAALAAANPVDRERAAALAVAADRTALLDALAAEPLPTGSRAAHRQPWALTVLVALLTMVAAAGVFTTPGRAVTGWVGERLGIGEPGEPGGPPALRQLNEAWNRASGLEDHPEYVLVVGPVTGQRRSRYEFIGYDPPARPDRPTWPRGPCFKLDLTQVRSMRSQGCGALPKGGDFAYLGVGGGYGHAYLGRDGLRFSDELLYLSGRVSPNVASVEATVDGEEIPVQVRPVPEELRRRFHLGRPFSFFVGFFSGHPRGGTVQVTARGADGELLGHAKTELIDQVASKKTMCRLMLREAKQLPRAGREECRAALGRGAR